MAKLTSDQRDDLRAIVEADGYKALILVLDALCQEYASNIVRMDLSNTSDRDLVISKARAEGANKLCKDLEHYITKLRSKT